MSNDQSMEQREQAVASSFEVDALTALAVEALTQKLVALRSEREQLTALVLRYTKEQRDLSDAVVVKQAQRVNVLLMDEQISQLFEYLRTQQGEQTREQTLYQPAMVCRSLEQRPWQAFWQLAQEEFLASEQLSLPIGE